MNTLRKTRLFVLLGVVALLVVGLSASSADAGCHYYGSSYYGHSHYVSPVIYHQPIVRYVAKPYSYPVTLIDYYGNPYVVWQTSYSTVPTLLY